MGRGEGADTEIWVSNSRSGVARRRRGPWLGWGIGLLVLGGAWAGAQRFQARLFDESDGLANLTVTAFAQQPDGRLWIGTENGLFRYDGSSFVEFGRSAGLSDPSVYSLLVDKTGTLWAGAHGGLFRWDGERFEEVRMGDKSLRIGVNSMLAATQGGELVVETSTGMASVEREGGAWVARHFHDRHPAFPADSDTDGVGVDGEGRIWFGCDAKLCSLAGDALEVYGPDRGVPRDYYVSLFCDREGRMWARGRKHILEWRAGEPRMRELTGGFPAGGIGTVDRRFAEDRMGRILTPTAKGFARWNGRAWTETLATSAGAIEGATDLFCDAEGSVWIGTAGSGLLHSLGYGLWENYSTADGLGGPALGALAVDKAGRLWAGHNLGASVLAPGAERFEDSPLRVEKDATYIQSLAADAQGGMWASALLGHIYHVSAAGRIDRRYEIDAYIKRLLLDRGGMLWVATSTGLYRLACEAQPCRLVRFGFADVAGGDIGDIALERDGSLLVGTRHGLKRIAGLEATSIAFDHAPGGISLLCVDRDGSLWMAGQSPGVQHVGMEGTRARLLGSYQRPRLASDMIEFLEGDAKGRVWIGTDHGVNVIDDGRVYHLTDEDGLIHNDTALRAAMAASDGTIWIGTGKGISHLLDPEKALARPPFAVAIEAARYGPASVSRGEKLRWNRETPVFTFSALTFRGNRKIEYHYRLAGFDAEETVSRDGTASYPRLPPGQYTFRVYAVDTGSGVRTGEAEWHFGLTPPWWKTDWFDGLAVALFLAAVAGAWYALHLALLAQRRRLQRMVAERTKELQQMAMHDSLTGLLNRRALLAALGEELEAAQARQTDLCIAIIDLDHFKRINDCYGHLAGDEVLRQAALRLSAVARSAAGREADMVGRYGGEEFLVIFRQAGYSIGLERCEALRQAMSAEPVRFEGHEITVTCSIGLSWIQSSQEPVTHLLAEADRALYSAKSKGRNLVDWAGESRETTVRRAAR